jgi:hypothetical protein
MENKGKKVMNRRKFIGGSMAAAATVSIVPRHVLGGVGFKAPSDTLNIAGVGVGGMGKGNLDNMESENIVALCDVDWKYANGAPLMPSQKQKDSGISEKCMIRWVMTLMRLW